MILTYNKYYNCWKDIHMTPDFMIEMNVNTTKSEVILRFLSNEKCPHLLSRPI